MHVYSHTTHSNHTKFCKTTVISFIQVYIGFTQPCSQPSTQLLVACSTEKWERAWYIFSLEWHQDRKDGRKGLVQAQNTTKRDVTKVTCHTYLASRNDCHIFESVETLPREESNQALPRGGRTWRHIVATISTLRWHFKGKNRGCKLQGSLYGLSHDWHVGFSTTVFARWDAAATIYFIVQFCAASIHEWLLIESGVY